MGQRGKVDVNEVKSALRHVVIPIIAGAAIAALDVIQSGAFDWGQMKAAALTAVGAGVMRFLQQWVKDNA